MSEPYESRQVCVIGLGNMGSALAEALLANGHRVTVWNRTSTKCEALAGLGAEVAKTPAEAVRVSDTVVMCVLDDEASREVLSSDGMDAAVEGKTLIQLTTIEPAESRALEAWARDRRARYLDGAILAYPSDVREGTGKIVYSGSKDVFDGRQHVLGSLGGKPIFVSEQAGLAPMTGNIVFARYYGITFAFLHAAAMAKAAEIPLQVFRELTGGDEEWMWWGRTTDRFLDKIERGHYATTEATLDLDLHGYNVFVRMCRDLGVEPALHEMIEDVLSRAVAEGRGDQEIAAIFEVLSGSSNQ